MDTKKVTKNDYFDAIIATLKGEATDIDVNAIVEFCETEKTKLAAKAVKAKEAAARKKEAGNALREAVLATLTTDYKAIKDIVAELDDEEVTNSKVAYRLKELVADGLAVKLDGFYEDEEGKRHKAMTYALANAE